MIKPSATHRAARAYAERFGWSVFPIRPGTKEPHGRFVRRGFQDATCDMQQIDRWWSACPDAPVAVACITSGVVVLDPDARNGGDETLGRLIRELGPLPQTPRVITPGGGEHYYFRDTVGAYVGTAGEGIDVKSLGYVLAPPSVHPNGGTYAWDAGASVVDTPLAELTDPWLRRLTTERGPALPSSGIDAASSWLGHAFAFIGWLGGGYADGRRCVRCPWLHEHSDGRGDGRDSSTVIFPRAKGATLGGFRCSHAHCAGRGWRDVVMVLPAKAKWAADKAMNAERNRIAYEQLAKVGS